MTTPTSPSRLRRLNLIAAALHTGQGLLILALSKAFLLPVTVSYLTLKWFGADQKLVPATHQLFQVNLAYLVVAFLLMSAAAHLIIATFYNRHYNEGLAKGINRGRWLEYSVSASTMMVAIAMLVGIYDAATLLAIFSLVAFMNLMGLVMEIHNQTTKQTKWVSFIIGCLAGAVPWIIVALSFWGSSQYGTGQIPTFVYWIYISIFLAFNCFALNMFLQYKKVGRWSNYIYGERVYIILSLVAKSALAWQVFAGTLRP